MACSNPTRLEIQKDNLPLNFFSCVFSLPLWHPPKVFFIVLSSLRHFLSCYISLSLLNLLMGTDTGEPRFVGSNSSPGPSEQPPPYQPQDPVSNSHSFSWKNFNLQKFWSHLRWSHLWFFVFSISEEPEASSNMYCDRF